MTSGAIANNVSARRAALARREILRTAQRQKYTVAGARYRRGRAARGRPGTPARGVADELWEQRRGCRAAPHSKQPRRAFTPSSQHATCQGVTYQGAKSRRSIGRGSSVVPPRLCTLDALCEAPRGVDGRARRALDASGPRPGAVASRCPPPRPARRFGPLRGHRRGVGLQPSLPCSRRSPDGWLRGLSLLGPFPPSVVPAPRCCAASPPRALFGRALRDWPPEPLARRSIAPAQGCA